MDPENVKQKHLPLCHHVSPPLFILGHFLTNILVDLQRGWMFLVLCQKWGTAQINWTIRTKPTKKRDATQIFGTTKSTGNWWNAGLLIEKRLPPRCYTHQPWLRMFQQKTSPNFGGFGVPKCRSSTWNFSWRGRFGVPNLLRTFPPPKMQKPSLRSSMSNYILEVGVCRGRTGTLVVALCSGILLPVFFGKDSLC